MATNDRKIHHIYVTGASARMVAGFADAAGLQVTTADFFADRDTRFIAETHRIKQFSECVEISEQVPFDAWIMTGGMENFPHAIESICSRTPLLGPAPEAIARCRNVLQLNEMFANSKLAAKFPNTCFSVDEMRSSGIAPEEWILKKTNRSGGHSVRFATANDLTGELPENTIAQKFVDGRALSGTYIANNSNCQLLQICSALDPEPDPQTGKRCFHYCGSLGPIDVSDRVTEAILQTGEAVADQFNLKGIFGIDFIESDPALYALEVNPRIPASMEISRLPKAELFEAHIEACLHPDKPLKSDWSHEKEGVHGKVILYNDRNAIEIDKRMSDQLLSMALPPYHANGFQVADIPSFGQTIATGQPVVTILANAPSAGKTESALCNAIEDIKTFLHWRS